MVARIHIYRDRAGKYRWNVALQISETRWNIICQSTDPKTTADAAELEARSLVCRAWELDQDIQHDYSQPSLGLRLWGCVCSWLWGAR